MRDPFWQRLISDTGPLGHLRAGELRQLGAVLRSALAAPVAGGSTDAQHPAERP